MVYTRPESIPFPHVWARFTAERDGETLRFLIRDVTPGDHETILEVMTKFFVRQEALLRSLDIEHDAAAVAALQAEWRRLLRMNTSLLCETDDSKRRLAAVNITYVLEKDAEKPQRDPQTISKSYGLLFSILADPLEKADVFNTLKCDKYLSAFGMLVLPDPLVSPHRC